MTMSFYNSQMPEELNFYHERNSEVPSKSSFQTLKYLKLNTVGKINEPDNRLISQMRNDIFKNEHNLKNNHTNLNDDSSNYENIKQTSVWRKITQSQNIYNKISTLATCPTNFSVNEVS